MSKERRPKMMLPTFRSCCTEEAVRRLSKNFILLVIIPHILLALGSAAPIPVLAIQSPDGDVIDCIKKEDQTALRNPLLKTHTLQEFPTGFQKLEQDIEPWQVWHETGLRCPAGTIPIRRDLSHAAFHSKSHPTIHGVGGADPTRGHKYAVAFKKTLKKVYATRATLNVWDPVVESDGDFSLAQLWLASGSYETSDINTIEAGWQVFRTKYNDSQPRLFTYWTRDAYVTGCYNTECDGFVHTSNTIALGAAITRTSVIGGTQLDITLQVWKDRISGNWWLGLGRNVEPVGYWPAAIFTLLSDHAAMVHWGGEVLYRNKSGLDTKAEMGSGEFASEGFRRSAYFCNLTVAEDNDTLLPVKEFGVRATHPKYYTVKKFENGGCGSHFHFGGPGPQRSGSVRGTVTYILFFLCFVVFLCV